VMFSDGVADAENEAEVLRSWLAEMSAGRSVQEIAENLLSFAAAVRGGRKDDMTAIVTRVAKG